MSRTKRWWLCPACRQPKKDHADDCTEEKRAVAKELLKMRKKKGKQSRKNRALYELLQKAQTGGKNDITKRVKLGGSEVTETMKLEPASPKSSNGSDNKPFIFDVHLAPTMTEKPSLTTSITKALI
ncbi:hypothetical protein B566_EDAN011027 [Ephemera danica]|nr:hypothetical protein B566_EDAN011027 [Ephemera danica]